MVDGIHPGIHHPEIVDGVFPLLDATFQAAVLDLDLVSEVGVSLYDLGAESLKVGYHGGGSNLEILEVAVIVEHRYVEIPVGRVNNHRRRC